MTKKMRRHIIEIITFAILLCCAVLNLDILWGVLRAIFHLFMPFILGGALAFIFNVPMKWIENLLFKKNKKLQKTKRMFAYVLTLILVIGILALALIIIIPELIKTGKALGQQIPTTFHSFQSWFKDISSQWPSLASLIESTEIDLSMISSKAVSLVQSSLTGLLSSGFGILRGLVSGIVSFIIGFVFSAYILFCKEKLAHQLHMILFALLPERRAKRMITIGELTNQTFSNFLSGQCLEACILGTMFVIVMSILQLPYAMLIGVIIAITALIPIVGAFCGCAIGMFLIVMVNPLQALWFLILFLILQQVEGNLIYPRVVGGSIGLPSMWVLVAVTVGGSLFGIAGILLFIPISSVCYALFREFILKRLRKKGL